MTWLPASDDDLRAFLVSAGWGADGAHRTLDLLGDDPPTWFLALTLARVTLGVLTLVALRLGAREEWCAVFVGLVFVSSLVHPRSSLVLLVFSALALVMTVVDVRRRRTPPQAAEQ